MSKLTAKQKRFCDEYLIDHNGKQACIRAGYSPKTAEVQASRLLSYAKVKAYLAKRGKQITEKIEVKQEDVLREYVAIGFSDIMDYFSVDESGVLHLKPLESVSETARRAVESIQQYTTTKIDKEGNEYVSVTMRFKLWSKPTALEMISRKTGGFVPKSIEEINLNKPLRIVFEDGNDA